MLLLFSSPSCVMAWRRKKSRKFFSCTNFFIHAESFLWYFSLLHSLSFFRRHMREIFVSLRENCVVIRELKCFRKNAKSRVRMSRRARKRQTQKLNCSEITDLFFTIPFISLSRTMWLSFQMRYTKKVSMWPVGLITKYGVSSPIVRNGTISGFYDGWIGGRKFPVDMAGKTHFIQAESVGKA